MDNAHRKQQCQFNGTEAVSKAKSRLQRLHSATHCTNICTIDFTAVVAQPKPKDQRCLEGQIEMRQRRPAGSGGRSRGRRTAAASATAAPGRR